MNKKQESVILANRNLKKALDALSIKIEARSTSGSGAWVTVIGEQTYKALPSYVVLNVRIVDNFVDFHRWAIADSTLDYEGAKKECYDEARAFYEDISTKLKSPTPTAEDEPTDHMEVTELDGTKTDWIN